MQFCAKCSLALIPIKKEKLVVLACPKCGEETRRSDPIVQKFGTAKESVVVIGKGEKNLQTLPKMKVSCQKCRHGKLSIGWYKLAVAMKPPLSSSNARNADAHGESIHEITTIRGRRQYYSTIITDSPSKCGPISLIPARTPLA